MYSQVHEKVLSELPRIQEPTENVHVRDEHQQHKTRCELPNWQTSFCALIFASSPGPEGSGKYLLEG